MKDQAAKLKAKLEERNKLSDQVELNIKFLMNKITPNNYDSIKKQIYALIREHNHEPQIFNSFCKNIFKKACFEKKYAEMYSKLCVNLQKFEIEKKIPEGTDRKEKAKLIVKLKKGDSVVSTTIRTLAKEGVESPKT